MKLGFIKKLDFLLALGLLIYAVWFNLNLYRLEPTVQVDPNDNNFQFALVDRSNQIWDYASRKCSGRIDFPVCHFSYMADHWVSNWAQGYNLPFYYSHIPQIAIVASFRALSALGLLGGMTLFTFYHWVIYLLLCLFPIPVFLAIRIVGLPWLYAGAAALLATHISTDGLYGLDPPSFLWRGWGLSSQLFAMIFLPLALAYAFRYLSEVSGSFVGNLTYELSRQVRTILPFLQPKPTAAGGAGKNGNGPGASAGTIDGTSVRTHFWLAVVFLSATIMGHLGIGVMAMLSAAVFAVTPATVRFLRQNHFREILDTATVSLIRIALLGGTVIFFLSYWIIPTFLGNDYHNISFWDPIWKFNSYGWKETLIRLFDGNLFDFGRFPILTVLALIGAFVPVFLLTRSNGQKPSEPEEGQHAADAGTETIASAGPLFSFSVLFLFWLLMYFGRSTWGGLIDMIPSMSEFHMSRFLVGLHAAGIFLFPIALYALSQILSDTLKFFLYPTSRARKAATPIWLTAVSLGAILVFLVPPVYRQTIKYNELNDKLIVQANENYAKQAPEINTFFATFRNLPPGRVFAGRGGGWGKDFNIAETEMFMYISTFGIPTALWLPETWSPNSDTEQYFSEDQAKDYDLYNLRFVLAPPTVKPQPFWTLMQRTPAWILYSAPSSGYFTVGRRSMTVVSDKTSLANIIRLWIQSEIPKAGLYPEIQFGDEDKPQLWPVPLIRMKDEVTYLTSQGKRQNIWEFNPLYPGDGPKAVLSGQESVDTDMQFRTRVDVSEGCSECLVVLKQTYHPNWRATVDGKVVKPITVFPFHIGVPIADPGSHDVVVWYQPMPLKTLLFTVSGIVALSLIAYPLIVRIKSRRAKRR
ncbi:hypothetical protein A2Z33_03805 [Candidatus Gottesmanbacteria bacterium RBG_16_52_11]|uniref:Membrane protein 6-pyruvoyl-tetrahydropterin synthase-related domain-containing protein n=1 Tax=Candidatus Gottesmanbacteria bacterium RBG_16_52_11 TaxID=1798374 RepID=A0A1F5YW99_9BACT|nr:MAG: hypothetical protein A2Z33_03805 [Candidatus Gottesmanbacteria bacterium RBG_16_52_11]